MKIEFTVDEVALLRSAISDSMHRLTYDVQDREMPTRHQLIPALHRLGKRLERAASGKGGTPWPEGWVHTPVPTVPRQCEECGVPVDRLLHVFGHEDERVCERCGGRYPMDRSCDCFDNGCE